MELRQWSFADTLAVKDMAVTSLTFLTSLTSTLVKLQFFNKISDSAGIQTQDLQNFFSTKSFSLKNIKGAVLKRTTP